MGWLAGVSGVAVAMAAVVSAQAQPAPPEARLRLLGSTPTTVYYLDLSSPTAVAGAIEARVYAVGHRYQQLMTWRIDCARNLQNVQGGQLFRGAEAVDVLPTTAPAAIPPRSPAETLAAQVCKPARSAGATEVAGWRQAISRGRLMLADASAGPQLPDKGPVVPDSGHDQEPSAR